MDYADLETLKAYAIIKSDTDDALLEALLSAASVLIDNYCGRIFGQGPGAVVSARTYTLDSGLLSETGRTLWLDEDLCSTPTYAETPAPTVTLIPLASPYQGVPYNRIVREDGIWPDPTVVTGFWSYSMLPPAPIVLATLRLTKWIYDQRQSHDSDRPIVMEGMVIMPSSLPADITTVLGPYRKMRLP